MTSLKAAVSAKCLSTKQSIDSPSRIILWTYPDPLPRKCPKVEPWLSSIELHQCGQRSWDLPLLGVPLRGDLRRYNMDTNDPELKRHLCYDGENLARLYIEGCHVARGSFLNYHGSLLIKYSAPRSPACLRRQSTHSSENASRHIASGTDFRHGFNHNSAQGTSHELRMRICDSCIPDRRRR